MSFSDVCSVEHLHVLFFVLFLDVSWFYCFFYLRTVFLKRTTVLLFFIIFSERYRNRDVILITFLLCYFDSFCCFVFRLLNLCVCFSCSFDHFLFFIRLLFSFPFFFLFWSWMHVPPAPVIKFFVVNCICHLHTLSLPITDQISYHEAVSSLVMGSLWSWFVK